MKSVKRVFWYIQMDKTDGILVVPKSTTTNDNVFQISHIHDYKSLDKKELQECCYVKGVYDGEEIWLLIKTYLEPNLIEVEGVISLCVWKVIGS